MSAPIRPDPSPIAPADLWESLRKQGLSPDAATAYVHRVTGTAPSMASTPAAPSMAPPAQPIAPANTPSAAPAGGRSTLYNALNTADNALTFGLGQKFNAAVDAAGDVIRGRDSFGHSFTKNLDADQQGIQQFRTAHPYGAAIANGIGGAAGVIAAAPLAAASEAGQAGQALTTGARTLQAGKLGAGLGAVAALGNAPNSGGVGRQLATGAEGAVMGGALSAGAVPFAQLVGSAAERLGLDNVSAPRASGAIPPVTADAAGLSGPVAGPAATPQAPAADAISRAMKTMLAKIAQSPTTPEQAISRATSEPANVPLTTMELFGKPVQRLARAVHTIPSAGSTQMADAIDQRAASELPGVIGALQEGTGLTRQNVVQTAKQLADARQANAQPLFAKAFADKSALPSEIYDGMLKLPFFDKAWAQAQRLAELDGVKLPQITVTKVTPGALPAAPDGFDEPQWAAVLKQSGVTAPDVTTTSKQTVPNLQAAHYVKLGLDDVVTDKLRAPLDRGGISNTMGTKVLQRLGEWTDALKAHSPDYANALNEYAGDSRMMEAQNKGTQLLKMHPDQITATMADMSDGEKEQFRASGMSAVRDLLDQVPETGSPAMALTKNQFIKDRIAALFSDASKLPDYQNTLAGWRDVRNTNRFVTGGSNTADKSLDVLSTGAPDWGQAAVTGLTGGGISGAAKSLARSVVKSNMAARAMGVTENTADALAPMLTSGSLPGAQSRAELIAQLRELQQAFAARNAALTATAQRQAPFTTGAAALSAQLPGRRGY